MSALRNTGAIQATDASSAEPAAPSARVIKVIGLGGIGGCVAQALAQFLTFRRTPGVLWLVDGDTYEERNRERMLFQVSGENKAVSKARELSAACGGAITILPVPEYATPRNVRRLIEEGDVIFLCVDNHASRKLVGNRCRRLKDVVLFSGGNDGTENGRDGTFGNIQVHIRLHGRDRTSPLTRFHPEIAKPPDKRPDQLGCGALAHSAPQLLFANLAVASAMLGAFYAWLVGRLNYEEVFLDVVEAKMTAVGRSPAGRKA